MNCIFNTIEASELRIIGANGVHACLGSILTLECVVNGEIGDTTVWEGTAFGGNCEITLLHLRFEPTGPGTFGQCNDGAITGQNVRVEGNSIYISQLEVKVTAEVIGKNIICTHDNGTTNTIGRYPMNIGIHCIAVVGLSQCVRNHVYQ